MSEITVESLREEAGIKLAGKGRGNWGHKGRPGKQGGSASSGGGGWPTGWEKYRDAKTQSDLTSMGLQDYLSGELRKEDITKIQQMWDSEHAEKTVAITQEQAIGMYTENSTISTSLRKGRELNDSEKQIVDRLDEAMQPVSEDTDLFRFVVIQGKEQNEAIYGTGGTRTGKEFSDEGYASTAESLQKAWKFNKEGAELWKISLKKGQKALDLGGKGSWGTEDELLLPRGTKFRITGRDYNEAKDISVLNLEVVD